MFVNRIGAALALLSLVLTLWQWLVALRFRFQAGSSAPQQPSPAPPVTLFKPLKGCDAHTESCLRSWLAQQYSAPVQALFGVASESDPVCDVVRRLQKEFPAADTRLAVSDPSLGANAKVCTLVALEQNACNDILVISDADVYAPPHLLADIVDRLRQPETGLVCGFYRLANPSTLAMQWEAVAVNADFWSQVLQSQSLKPLDFALGAVMAVRRAELKEIGGFRALLNCLADDYQLGHRIARLGRRIALSPMVVECWSAPMNWSDVWRHQLRWARTIRVCQPVPYFFSLLANATLWPLLWLAVHPSTPVLGAVLGCILIRAAAALYLDRRLAAASANSTGRLGLRHVWLVWLKDLLQAVIWLLSFAGNRIDWRGQRFRLRRDGTLVRPS